MPKEDGIRQASMLLDEVSISKHNAHKLQHIPVGWLQRAHAEVLRKVRPTREIVGITTSTPVLDGTYLPADPFAPTAMTLSANVPVMVGWCRTEETLFQQPTPKNLTMDDAQLIERVKDRLGAKRKMADDVIAAYKSTHPNARPWDLYTFICTDQPRGTYPKVLAVRKAALGAAPTFVYRFDWDLGNELKTPHALEIPFAFDNIDYGIGLFDIPKTDEAYAFAKKMSATWAAFARNGNPNTPDMPDWSPYTRDSRTTMILNNQSRTENDPESETRKIMQQVLDL
jgi:para-nitrobenzyl esterase